MNKLLLALIPASIMSAQSSWSPLRTIIDATEGVNALLFHPDGKKLLSAGGKIAQVWDIETGDQLTVFSGHSHSINCMALHKDGAIAASSGKDSVVRLWNIANGKQTNVLRNPADSWSHAIAFHPEFGQLVASFGKHVRMWNIYTRDIEWEMYHPDSWCRSLAFDAQGAQLAMGFADGSIRIYDMATKACRTIRDPSSSSELFRLTALHPESMLYAYTQDEYICTRNIGSGTTKFAGPFTDDITHLSLSDNGKRIIATSFDKTTCVWGTQPVDHKIELTLESSRLIPLVAALNEQGTRLAIGLAGRNIEIWSEKQ